MAKYSFSYSEILLFLVENLRLLQLTEYLILFSLTWVKTVPTPLLEASLFSTKSK